MSDDRLWMAVKRRTLNHHLVRVDAIHTACDRWVGHHGDGEYGHGVFVDAGMVAKLDSPPCPRCWPETARQRHRPTKVVDVELPAVTS